MTHNTEAEYYTALAELRNGKMIQDKSRASFEAWCNRREENNEWDSSDVYTETDILAAWKASRAQVMAELDSEEMVEAIIKEYVRETQSHGMRYFMDNIDYAQAALTAIKQKLGE